MIDEMLEICIGQRYVPPGCKMDGMLVWALINEGRNPCDGCNVDCVHRRCPESIKERHISKEELEYEERIEKRKSLGTNSETIIYVDTDYDGTLITAIDPNSEKGYSVRCKRGVNEACCYIYAMCSKYKARQVIIILNGYGIAIYDCLRMKDLKDIDIVPIRLASARI